MEQDKLAVNEEYLEVLKNTEQIIIKMQEE